MNAYTKNYQSNQILNAPPERILIMLYDGAIRFCREAQRAIDDDIAKLRAEKVSRAMAIVSELSNTLDRDIGGEIAENLDALYGFMMRELTRSNIEKDKDGLGTVEDLLVGLRETWVEAIELNHQASKQASAGNSADSPVQHLSVSM